MAAPDDPDMMAAELVLGLLDGDDHDVALRRLAQDPVFAAEVEQWNDWFAALFARWPSVEAPASVASRLDATLDARSAGRVSAANDNGGRWRTMAMAASLVACLLLAVTTILALRPAPAPVRVPVPVPVTVAAPPPLIAAITPTAKGAPIAAAYDKATGAIRLAGGVDVPAGRSAQLWAIRGTDAPRPLGVMSASGPAQMIVPASARAAMAADTLLAISIEPAGGSPTGLPTGPVVAAGKLSG